jgi:hypothetical protein
MKVKFPLFVLVLVMFLSTMHAQNSSNMGVVVQSTDDNSDKSTTTVHLLNISNKEVIAFNLSVQQTLPGRRVWWCVTIFILPFSTDCSRLHRASTQTQVCSTQRASSRPLSLTCPWAVTHVNSTKPVHRFCSA